MDGGILVDGEKVTKPGKNVPILAKIELLDSFQESRYVSRGGTKLERALTEFGVPVEDRICLDVGASTGGFTDCLLKFGAKLVYAVDVGYGQLDWSLRSDQRVIVRERSNARYLKPEDIYPPGIKKASLVVIDVSFISLKLILPPCLKLVDSVHEASTHVLVLKSIVGHAEQLGFKVHHLTHSPLLGPAGNIEFLLHLGLDQSKTLFSESSIAAIVDGAHRDLKTKPESKSATEP
jgi:23S rRNA (cytidine1920-2'-O)/16S rRNA (cytidine1409-2'-O)-methyltransferase